MNDVAKNAGRKILCKAEKKVKSRLSKCMVEEANVVGSIDAIDSSGKVDVCWDAC